MTTICWDGETLAADRRTTMGGAIYRHTTKLVQIPGGWAAGCGTVTQIKKFMAWAKAGMRGKGPADLEDCNCVVIKGGKSYVWEDGVAIDMDEGEKFALGSGWKWAAAAMDFGCSAAEAVEYASTRDSFTGGGVDTCQPLVKVTKPRKRR